MNRKSGSSSKPRRSTNLIETAAIIVAYAMSRFDKEFLRKFGYNSWSKAFLGTGKALGVRPASMKNLRDEFDPIHPNGRRGWKRPLRRNRQRVLGEFCDASDEAVLEIVSRLLAGDKVVETEVTKPIAAARDEMQNVAERLRTGRLAEEFFLENSMRICGLGRELLVDCRQLACGFDFGVEGQSRLAIEVKGLKELRGQILFTDNEWNQANRRAADYWLVVVGGIDEQPRGKMITDPASTLKAISSIHRTSVVSWRAKVVVS
jgi:hypothetical protein